VRELSEQSDLAHADGRARFAELARPQFAKVPAGVYRELLLERLAQVVGLGPQRLEELWSAGRGSAAASAPEVPAAPAGSAVRAGGSAGRGSLVRQAIVRLVHYPAIAAEVSDRERSGLDACEEPGSALLRELLDDLRARPVRLPAQLIQRWSGREGGEWLEKLLAREEVITDVAAAAGELRATLLKLADLAASRRLEALEAKSRSGPLEPSEMHEFQRLISTLGGREARRP
jgi:DNA primase